MQEEKSLWNSAVSFLKVLSPLIKTIQAIEKKDMEGAKDNGLKALQSIVMNWSNLEYGWTQVNAAAQKLIREDPNNYLELAKKKPADYGFYTGKWTEQRTSYYIYTFNAIGSKIINLYWPKESGVGYNTYAGIFDDSGAMIWTGSNGITKLILIGYPYNEGNNLQLYHWYLNVKTNNFELLDILYLTYIQ